MFEALAKIEAMFTAHAPRAVNELARAVEALERIAESVAAIAANYTHDDAGEGEVIDGTDLVVETERPA